MQFDYDQTGTLSYEEFSDVYNFVRSQGNQDSHPKDWDYNKCEQPSDPPTMVMATMTMEDYEMDQCVDQILCGEEMEMEG